jgi:hypothetical protein
VFTYQDAVVSTLWEQRNSEEVILGKMMRAWQGHVMKKKIERA